jgi:hypothetical protein
MKTEKEIENLISENLAKVEGKNLRKIHRNKVLISKGGNTFFWINRNVNPIEYYVIEGDIPPPKPGFDCLKGWIW